MIDGGRCAVCSSPRRRRLFSHHGYPVGECRACGLRFLDPQPDDATLGRIYSEEYFLGEPGADAEVRVSALKRATAALYVDALRSCLGAAEGRLLEVGCGRGELLLEARTRGFEVAGLEISPHAAATANRLLGADRVTVGAFDNLDLPPDTFDAVVFADVIEHVRDPLEFLRRMHRLLKAGGLAFLITPTLDSVSARVLGRHWMEYKVEHLFYFGSRSMRVALRRSGFVDVTVAANLKVLSVDYLDHHFRRFPVPLITPTLGFARRLLPRTLAHRHVRLPASGMLVTGRKR